MAICSRCRGDHGNEVGTFNQGRFAGTIALCDDCIADCLDHADRVCAEFEAHVSAGIARADANAIVILRMEGRIARA